MLSVYVELYVCLSDVDLALDDLRVTQHLLQQALATSMATLHHMCMYGC